jgi:uncharacterized protein (TIGR03643 family)
MKPRVNESLSVSDIDRIIQMAWEDRTSFDVIRTQFGLRPGEVISVMRRELKPRKTKHVALRGFEVGRFRCPSQKSS